MFNLQLFFIHSLIQPSLRRCCVKWLKYGFSCKVLRIRDRVVMLSCSGGCSAWVWTSFVEHVPDTHTHTQTQTHTYNHTYIHTYTHTHNHTYIHTDIHTYSQSHIHPHTYTHTHNHTYIHTHTPTQTHTRVRAMAS